MFRLIHLYPPAVKQSFNCLQICDLVIKVLVPPSPFDPKYFEDSGRFMQFVINSFGVAPKIRGLFPNDPLLELRKKLRIEQESSRV